MNKAGKYPLKSFWKISLFALLLKSLLRPFKVSFEVSVPVTSDPSEIAAEIYSLKINKSESHSQPLVYVGGERVCVCVCTYVTSRNCLQHGQVPLLFCLMFRFFTGTFFVAGLGSESYS